MWNKKKKEFVATPMLTDKEREELKEKSLQTMNFHHGTKLALLKEGYRTIGDVVNETSRTIGEVRRIGPARLKELKEQLREVGLFLRKPNL